MKIGSIVSFALLAVLASATAQAGIIGVTAGDGAPAGTLGGYTMTAFDDDTRPTIADVTSVDSPLGGAVAFDIAMSHREIGSGWATWSHGYTGDVYYTNGATEVTMTMPADTFAFYFYAEPTAFSTFTFTAEADDGTSVSQSVAGDSGASYFGFYGTGGTSVASITVSMSDDFAVGEFGISATAVPLPPAAFMGLALLAGVGVMRRRRRSNA